LKNDHGQDVVIEYSENIIGHPRPYEVTGEWVELDEQNTKTTLQNVTPHVGGIWEHPSDPVTEEVTANYLYLKSESGVYTILGTEEPNNLDTSYYRIRLSNDCTKTTVVTEAVSRGNLIEERSVNESYYVENYSKDSSTGIETINLLYKQTVDLVETVTGEGTRTITVTYTLPTSTRLQRYATYYGGGYWSTQQNDMNPNTLNLKQPDPVIEEVESLSLVDEYHDENYFKRNITRQSFTNQVQIESMEWSYFDASNNQVSVEFTYDSPFDLMQDYTLTNGTVVRRQKYFLSECYSKNFPFSVNVLFVQLIE